MTMESIIHDISLRLAGKAISPITIPQTLASILLLCLLTVIIKRRYLSPLSPFPGPFLASFTRLWYTYITYLGLQDTVLPALHKEHGPYLRVAPNELHITDPAYLKEIYGPGSQYRKSDFYKVFQGTRKFDLVSERNPKIHAAHKKLVAQAYSMSSVRQSEGAVDVTLELLIKRFDARVGEASPFDISEWIQFWSFDTVGMLTFAKTFGFLEQGRDWTGVLLQNQKAFDSAVWLGMIPAFFFFCQRYVFPVTKYILPASLRNQEGNFFSLRYRAGEIRTFAIEQAVERQKKEVLERPDIMSSLLAVHEKKPEFDTDALHSMVASNVAAGAETTASSLRAMIYFVLKNPECKAKLVEEIDRGCKEAGIPPGSVVPFTVAEKMKYLNAVIYEGMRMFPAIGLPSARVVPPQGLEVDGKRLPGGTQVTVFPWSLHRESKVFGQDAQIFNPERLLQSEKAYYYFQQNFASFGGGSRICLGRSVAMMEMTKCLATLFGRYEVHLADPDQEWVFQGSFIKDQKNIVVRLSERGR